MIEKMTTTEFTETLKTNDVKKENRKLKVRDNFKKFFIAVAMCLAWSVMIFISHTNHKKSKTTGESEYQRAVRMHEMTDQQRYNYKRKQQDAAAWQRALKEAAYQDQK